MSEGRAVGHFFSMFCSVYIGLKAMEKTVQQQPCSEARDDDSYYSFWLNIRDASVNIEQKSHSFSSQKYRFF